jgi:hypothetical protein
MPPQPVACTCTVETCPAAAAAWTAAGLVGGTGGEHLREALLVEVARDTTEHVRGRGQPIVQGADDAGLLHLLGNGRRRSLGEHRAHQPHHEDETGCTHGHADTAVEPADSRADRSPSQPEADREADALPDEDADEEQRQCHQRQRRAGLPDRQARQRRRPECPREQPHRGTAEGRDLGQRALPEPAQQREQQRCEQQQIEDVQAQLHRAILRTPSDSPDATVSAA